MRRPVKAARDFLTGLISPRSYWEFRSSWRPMHAIIGKEDPERHLASGKEVLRLMEHLDVLSGVGTTLAIGSGGGRIEHWIHPHVRACVGVDISHGMAKIARGNVPATNALFVVGSGSDVAAVRTASIDLVYSFIVFQHMGDGKVRSYFRDAARVLRPGGRFLFQIATDPRRRFVPFRERHPYAIRWRRAGDVYVWLEEVELVVERLLKNDWTEVARAAAEQLPEESLTVLAVKPPVTASPR